MIGAQTERSHFSEQKFEGKTVVRGGREEGLLEGMDVTYESGASLKSQVVSSSYSFDTLQNQLPQQNARSRCLEAMNEDWKSEECGRVM